MYGSQIILETLESHPLGMRMWLTPEICFSPPKKFLRRGDGDETLCGRRDGIEIMRGLRMGTICVPIMGRGPSANL